MFFCCLVSSNSREQKKFPPKMSPSLSKCFATVYARVDLPEPASPVNQKMGGDLSE